jgi:arylsulfatase A-like enzyme
MALLPLLLPWTLLSCGPTPDPADIADPAEPDDTTDPYDGPPNLLVVLTDDQGTDLVQGWDDELPIATPHMASLVDQGTRFTAAWASPTCTPSRAALLTGRHPRRYGLGSVLGAAERNELPLEEITLPEALPEAYRTAAFGKWHLATAASTSGLEHPRAQGFDTFAGTMTNISSDLVPDDEANVAEGYYRWEEVRDGEVRVRSTYVTTATIDDAVAAVADLPEPWLVYVALHAPHTPLDPPPPELGARPVDDDDPKPERLRALVEAADTELGRLLDAVQPVASHTYVVFLSDNGSAEFAYEPERLGKNTTLEAGLRVPFVVRGPGVPAGVDIDHPVHLVDLWPTLVDLAGGDEAAHVIDGRSLVPALLGDPDGLQGRIVYSEKFLPNGLVGPYNHDWRIARDERFKYVWRYTDETELVEETLHDLWADGDATDLLEGPLDAEAEAAYARLSADVRDRVVAMEADVPHGPSAR